MIMTKEVRVHSVKTLSSEIFEINSPDNLQLIVFIFIGFYLKLLHLAITILNSCSFLVTLNLGGPLCNLVTSIKMQYLQKYRVNV